MDNLNEPLVHIVNIFKSFKTGQVVTPVLKGISVDIAPGEICVLFGPSGSGKSTFLNVLGGLDSCDSGALIVEGEDIASLSSSELIEYRRKNLGFIFQFYNLIPDLTIKENIEVGANISKDPLDVDTLIKDLGLWEHRNKFPNQVSGGQQQRCSIGRALVKNPSLLLCDEPTGALDYKTAKEILQLLEHVNQKYKCTMVIVTHNEAIRHMSNHILSIRDGVFVEDIYNDEVISASDITW